MQVSQTCCEEILQKIFENAIKEFTSTNNTTDIKAGLKQMSAHQLDAINKMKGMYHVYKEVESSY